jgi:predicted kinase
VWDHFDAMMAEDRRAGAAERDNAPSRTLALALFVITATLLWLTYGQLQAKNDEAWKAVCRAVSAEHEVEKLTRRNQKLEAVAGRKVKRKEVKSEQGHSPVIQAEEVGEVAP